MNEAVIAMTQALQHDPTALVSQLPTVSPADTNADIAASGLECRNAVVFILASANIRRVRFPDPANFTPEFRISIACSPGTTVPPSFKG